MHSFFDPSSPQARAVGHLWWWMVGVGGAIWLGTTAIALYAAFARRGHRESDDLQHVSSATYSRIERLVAGGVFVTVLILIGFLIFDFAVGRAIAQHPHA